MVERQNSPGVVVAVPSAIILLLGTDVGQEQDLTGLELFLLFDCQGVGVHFVIADLLHLEMFAEPFGLERLAAALGAVNDDAQWKLSVSRGMFSCVELARY